MNYPDINILVNGNRCKFYYHEGKTYIEAKHGSEYEIEIKNTGWGRIEAVCSVDGLSVMTGKSADEKENGYVIDAYHPLRIKGFRYSNDHVGSFKFELKENSYAASKGKKAKRNCGVIGIRLFEEEQEPVLLPTVWINHIYHHDDFNPKPYTKPYKPYWDDNITWCGTNSLGGNFSTTHEINLSGLNSSVSTKGLSVQPMKSCYDANVLRSVEQKAKKQPKGFDMGTAWGSKKESKVVTVSFNRGSMGFSTDIYYASRDSLIEMGVPIENHTKVVAPKSFPGGYAQPPKGWNG